MLANLLAEKLKNTVKEKIIESHKDEFPSAQNFELDGNKLKMQINCVNGNRLGTYQGKEFFDFIYLDDIKYAYVGIFNPEITDVNTLSENELVVDDVFIYERGQDAEI